MKENTINLDEVNKDQKKKADKKNCEREIFCLPLTVNMNICSHICIKILDNIWVMDGFVHLLNVKDEDVKMYFCDKFD